jgi:hypothetical protein
VPGGDAQAQAAWDAMVANYEANVVGDIAGAVLDVVDLTTLGFANVQPIQAGLRVVKELWDATGSARGMVFTVLQGWFNVWGGEIVEQVGGAEGLSRAVAGGQIALELQRIKASYQLGDLMIGEAAEYVAGQIAELEQGAELVLGGRDPFITARDAAVEGLAALEAQIADIGEMGALSTTGAEKAAAVEEACTEGLELLDTIELPELDVPESDLGEGAAADLAEGALNMAGDIAEAGLGMALGQLQAQIDLAKDALRAPLETMRENAVAFGEFMQLVSEEAAVQLAVAEERAERVRGQLAKCESLEDIIDTVIEQILETVGLHADFEVDDLRQAWGELGVTIDEAIVWAEALRDGREAPAPVVADAEPVGLGHEDQNDDQDRR